MWPIASTVGVTTVEIARPLIIGIAVVILCIAFGPRLADKAKRWIRNDR